MDKHFRIVEVVHTEQGESLVPCADITFKCPYKDILLKYLPVCCRYAKQIDFKCDIDSYYKEVEYYEEDFECDKDNIASV